MAPRGLPTFFFDVALLSVYVVVAVATAKDWEESVLTHMNEYKLVVYILQNALNNTHIIHIIHN